MLSILKWFVVAVVFMLPLGSIPALLGAWLSKKYHGHAREALIVISGVLIAASVLILLLLVIAKNILPHF